MPSLHGSEHSEWAEAERWTLSTEGQLQLSARAKKRARQKATRDGPLAIQNGGVGDGIASSSKGKGKSKGKSDDRFEGTPICYNWNRGAPCNQSPCDFAHVCFICHDKSHPKSEHRG